MSFIHLALRSAATRQLANPSLSRLSKGHIPQRMAFSAASALDKAQIETRVLDVLKTFEKVHPEKVWLYSNVPMSCSQRACSSSPPPPSRTTWAWIA